MMDRGVVGMQLLACGKLVVLNGIVSARLSCLADIGPHPGLALFPMAFGSMTIEYLGRQNGQEAAC